MSWLNLEQALSDVVIETFGEPMRLQHVDLDVEIEGILERGYQPQQAAGERMPRHEVRATIPEQESTALVGARLTARGVQYRVSRVQDNLDGTFVLDLGRQS
jgi:hypothetical protein